MSRIRGLGLAAALCIALFAVTAQAATERVGEYTANGWNLLGALRAIPTSDFATGTTPEGKIITSGINAVTVNADNFLNAATGEYYADILGATIGLQREFRRALPSIYSYSQTAHYQDRGTTTTASLIDNGDGTYVVCPTTMCAPGKKWVMWDVPFLYQEKRDQNGSVTTGVNTDRYLGYKQTASGFATGISRMLGATSAIGLAVGYDDREMKNRDNSSYFKNKADTLHLALYGGTNIGFLFLDAYAGYSHSWNKTHRYVPDANNIAANAPYDINRGKFSDHVLSAGLKASYVWILGNDVRITPSVGLDFSHSRLGSFTETGWKSNNENAASNSTLAVDKGNYSSLALPITVSMNRTWNSSFLAFGGHDSLWTPEIRGGYIPVIGNKRASLSGQYAPGGTPALPTFTTQSTALNGSYATAGAGLKIKLRDKYIFGVDYDYTGGKDYSNHSLTAMYGVSF